MSFVDTLKIYHQKAAKRKEESQSIERFIDEIVLRAVKGVKNKAEYAARQGENSISGYLIFQDDEKNSPLYDSCGVYMIGFPSFDWAVLVDRMPGYGPGYCKTTIAWKAWLLSNKEVKNLMLYKMESTQDTLMLSEQTTDTICIAVSKKLEELGFEHFSVVPKKIDFYKEQAKSTAKKGKNYFIPYNKPREYEYHPYKTATLLWIEASW